MLHEPLIPAADVDPDVVQAIRDFRGIVERINANGLRVVKHAVGSHPRRQIETQIGSDMELLRARAERLGDGWTAESLLEAVRMDMNRRARRTAQPRIGTERFHNERVQAAVAAEARAKTALDSARLEYEAATSARMAAERAARHLETRRVTR